MLPPDYTLVQTDWTKDQESLSAIRREVFMEEQAVSAADEWDGLDDQAVHFLIRTPSGESVATARILREGETYHIGRLAVSKPYRGRGLGTTLMKHLLAWCTEESTSTVKTYLNAQADACEFYERLGFEVRGELFMDAGIPHRRMEYAPSAQSQDTFKEAAYKLLTQREDFQKHALILCQHARRQILILSDHLDPPLYDQASIAEAVTRLIRRHRQARVQILVNNINPMLERGHQLLRLAQRLPSSVEIRKASAEAESQGQHFLLADAESVLYQQPGSDYRGHVHQQSGAEVKKLRELFERDWQHAEVDPRLRRLYL